MKTKWELNLWLDPEMTYINKIAKGCVTKRVR